MKGNELNKLKKGRCPKQTMGDAQKKKPQGKGGALNNVKDGGYSNQTERKKVP